MALALTVPTQLRKTTGNHEIYQSLAFAIAISRAKLRLINAAKRWPEDSPHAPSSEAYRVRLKTTSSAMSWDFVFDLLY